MSPIRLLPLSLFAFTLTAAAQTPAATASNAGVKVTIIPANNNRLVPLPNVNGSTLTAQLNPPCAMIRSYGFTYRDLGSLNPRASKYSTCTPMTSGKLLAIQIPANVKPAKSK
ncbi:MAG: hypothetical protein HIU91_00370 [Acidobacteria bacterium]|nr:hypothetical protein [Acidobacteriota bacterium]